MTVPLDIYAGPAAIKKIKQQGFSPQLFTTLLGASGGPKWFVLTGIDRVLFSEFFANSVQAINVIGSSAGAFRAACFSQKDSRSAIDRLAYRYSHTEYSNNPTPAEITRQAGELLDYILGENGVEEIINNRRVRLNIIATRCLGLMQYEHKLAQILGLTLSIAANLVSRKRLAWLYRRSVFSVQPHCLKFSDPYGIPTEKNKLTTVNLKSALLASGAIPMVLQGVGNIVGTIDGTYRDGGIVDYHFDLNIASHSGLVLYPHFYPYAIPGWFDKGLRSRIPHHQSYTNTVMLVPSADFVAKLPYGKIPDRKDFEALDAKTRITYWRHVIAESDRLGEYFIEQVSTHSIVNNIKPLPFKCQQ